MLYCILDLGYVPEDRVEAVARDLIAGGADLLQLRAKGYPEETIEAFALRVLPICRESGVPFIINDFPELAARIGADGVHIGQDDGSLADVRALFQSAIRNPQSTIVGRSTHSVDQARAALVEGFDYIGFGPLFPTPTKKGRPGIGIENIALVEAEVGSRIPVFCIGGIKRDNLREVLAAGTRRAVLVSDLLCAPDIAAATREARELLTADCGSRVVD